LGIARLGENGCTLVNAVLKIQERQTMLVLSRKRGEKVMIGNGITVTVLAVAGNRVKLGFAGPAEVPIHREEIHDQIQGFPSPVEWPEPQCV
jgi:carbon storage regulator